MVPALPIALSLAPTLVELAMADRHELKMKRVEANAQLAAMDAELKRLEIESHDKQVQAQRDILQSLIDASTHAFDKKIEAFSESFRLAHALIEGHQQAMLEEQKDLREKMFDDDLTESQFLAANNRLSEVSGMLIDLKKSSRLMTQEFNQRIAETSIELEPMQARIRDMG